MSESFNCCGGELCSAITNRTIDLINLDAMQHDYNSIGIIATGYGIAYTVTVQQSDTPDFMVHDDTVVNVPATGNAFQNILIYKKYIKINITTTVANTKFLVCRKLRMCCKMNEDITVLLQEMIDALVNFEVKIDHISIEADNIDLNTDDLESLIASIGGLIDSDIDTVNLNLNDIQAKMDVEIIRLGLINTGIGTVNTNLGTINTSLGTINTGIGTVNTNLGTINTSLGTINTSLGTIDTDINKLITNDIRRTVLYGQWYGDRNPYYNPNWGQVVTLVAGGYTPCIPSDVGKIVVDDGGNTGALLDFDNTNRIWYVSWGTIVAANSVMTIAGGGTGAGTSVNANSTSGLYRRCLCLNPKPANLSSSSADVLTDDYASYDIVGATDTAKIIVMTKEFALPYSRTQPITIEGTAKAVTTAKCKGDGTRTVYIDCIVATLYKETALGVRTPLFTETYPNLGTGLLSTSVASFTDPITASFIGKILAVTIAITETLVLQFQVYAHVSANNNISDAVREYWSRGGLETTLELPVTVNPGMI